MDDRMYDFKEMMASVMEAKVKAKLNSGHKKNLDSGMQEVHNMIDNFIDYLDHPEGMDDDEFNDWLDAMRKEAIKYVASKLKS